MIKGKPREANVKVPIEISYREVNKTDELDNLIREKIDKLEKICDYMTSGRVAVEKPQQNLKAGNPYRVRLEFRIPPQHQIIVKREPGEGEKNDPLEAVIRDAFEAARKQIKELVEKSRKDVKKHPEQEVAAIVNRVFPDEGYGFIRAMDGREIYFHKNSVLNDEFTKIKEGTGVRYFEVQGEKGPQASTVQIIQNPS